MTRPLIRALRNSQTTAAKIDATLNIIERRIERVHQMTGATIRAWRTRLGLSQSQAARRLKVSVRSLQHWEQGRRVHPFRVEELKRRMK